MDDLLTVDAVAERVGVTADTVYRWIQDGHMRSVRLGTGPRARHRIPSEEVSRFLDTPPAARPAARWADEPAAITAADHWRETDAMLGEIALRGKYIAELEAKVTALTRHPRLLPAL